MYNGLYIKIHSINMMNAARTASDHPPSDLAGCMQYNPDCCRTNEYAGGSQPAS